MHLIMKVDKLHYPVLFIAPATLPFATYMCSSSMIPLFLRKLMLVFVLHCCFIIQVYI